MKMVLKLLLIYIVCQIIGSVLAMPLLLFADKTTSLSVGLTLSSVLMLGYLWKKHYLKVDKSTWSIGTKFTFAWLIPFALGGYFFATYINSYLNLPNLLEDQFVDMSSNVFGILSIVLIGPVAEEFLFRGVMMNYFLEKKGYDSRKTIFLSALIFGIIHFNPAQVVYAFLLGLFLGRIYYQTGSLLLCSIVHVSLNGFSTLLTIYYPDVDDLKDLFGNQFYPWLLPLSAILILSSSAYLKKLKAPDWHVRQDEEDELERMALINEESK